MTNKVNVKLDNQLIIRTHHLAEKIVFIDGLPGCGKTLFPLLLLHLGKILQIGKIYKKGKIW